MDTTLKIRKQHIEVDHHRNGDKTYKLVTQEAEWKVVAEQFIDNPDDVTAMIKRNPNISVHNFWDIDEKQSIEQGILDQSDHDDNTKG